MEMVCDGPGPMGSCSVDTDERAGALSYAALDVAVKCVFVCHLRGHRSLGSLFMAEKIATGIFRADTGVSHGGITAFEKSRSRWCADQLNCSVVTTQADPGEKPSVGAYVRGNPSHVTVVLYVYVVVRLFTNARHTKTEVYLEGRRKRLVSPHRDRQVPFGWNSCLR